ncbi:Proteasome inhibitor-related [Melia azedarach]|uniref:Proteasome inhibitor-related n=1 Tax=Melia azedarach TaxID=155640 RepID=A0ACC1X086_MELAZ|nr:Proteasome inhibitor-related [Melia azedarach]
MANDKSVMAVIRAARPTFRNESDKLAFAVHASFLAAGNVLNATGPTADAAFSSPSTDEVGIDHWNELDDSYTFVYINPEKGSKKVLVKCLVMKDKLLVSALADGASEPVHLEINVGDYVGESGGNYSNQFKNLEKLVRSIDTQIISKLYGSSNPASSERSEGSRRNVNEPHFESFEPRGPQPFPAGIPVPPINPGHGSDIFPGPGAGMYPRRGGFGGDGSMLIGPDDPRWFGGIDGEPGFPGANPLVPPGARFDPYGPPGTPGFEPNRFIRRPRRPDGTHPDLEHRPGGSDFI